MGNWSYNGYNPYKCGYFTLLITGNIAHRSVSFLNGPKLPHRKGPIRKPRLPKSNDVSCRS